MNICFAAEGEEKSQPQASHQTSAAVDGKAGDQELVHAPGADRLSGLLRDTARLSGLGKLDEAEAACRAAIEQFPHAAEAHFNLARLLVKFGRITEALTAFQAAADLNPEDQHYLISLADMLRQHGQPKAATLTYKKVLELTPDHVWAHVGLGYLAMEGGPLQEAVAHFRTAVRQRPSDIALCLRLAELAQRTGGSNEAATLFARVLEQQPGNLRAHVGLGHLARSQGRAADAVEHYRAAAAARAEDADLQLDIADLLSNLGRHAEATAAYQQALVLNPGHARAHIGLGHIARANGNRPEALRHFEAAAALQPTEPERQMNLADELREAGRVEEAEARYRDALNLAPKNGWAFFGLGKCARARGRRGEAVAYFNACALLEPHNVWPLVELAQEQQDAGNRDDARKTLETLLNRFPSNKQGLVNLGNLERYSGNLGRALELFSQGNKAYPAEVAFFIRMAEICREQNDEAAFLAHINAALALEPHNASVIQALAGFHLAKDRPEEGLALFVAALEVHPDDLNLVTAYASVLANAGFAEECLAILDDLHAKGVDSPAMARQSISLLRLSGRIPEAIARARAAVQSWPHSFHLKNELFHAGLFWEDTEELEHWLAEMVPATKHETSVVSRNKARLAELHFHLAEATRHYEDAATLNETDASLQNDLARLKMMQLDLAGAREHLTRARDLDAPNLRMKGKSLNISQSMFGQILDELLLSEHSCPVQPLRALAVPERLAALGELVRTEPGNTAVAMQVVLALREEGMCVWQNDGQAGGVPKHIIQFWDSSDAPEDIAAMMQSWRERNPDYNVRLFNDRTAHGYLQAHFPPSVAYAYQRVREPAQKSDLFRLAVLALEGGVYADADDRCIGPLAPLLGAQDQLVIYHEEFGTIGNNFVAAGPRHPVILNALGQAVNAINRGDADIVWLSTGPALMTRVFAQGYFSPGGLPGRTRLLDRHGLGRVVAMHCTASYKRGVRHWLNTNFARGLLRRNARIADKYSDSQ